MLNPMRDKNEGTYRGERRDDTCDHGLSRRSLRVQPPTSWKVKLMRRKKKRWIFRQFMEH